MKLSTNWRVDRFQTDVQKRKGKHQKCSFQKLGMHSSYHHFNRSKIGRQQKMGFFGLPFAKCRDKIF